MTTRRNYYKCQSCRYPIKNNINKGSNNDGTLSLMYCNFCYHKGEFIEPTITLKEMQKTCVKRWKEDHHFWGTVFAHYYKWSIKKLHRWKNKKNS